MDYFAVQRSVDGLRFEEVARVEGHGFSAEKKSYQWHDRSPLTKAYYRLVSVDLDGATESFAPVRVQLGVPAGLSLYPNPAVGPELFLAIAGAGAEVVITYADGRAVWQARVEPGTTAVISTTCLPAFIWCEPWAMSR